tara:strand:+ start:1864 stop:2211 length:348 start_codon:yes stop_codon:yes gene_type:complete
MRKIIGLILAGFMLSGCYASSLTYVGTGAGIIQGKSIQSAAAQATSIAVKQRTGKSPIEHILNPDQIKTYNNTKAKLNPCEQTPELCSKISLRVAVINNILESSHKNLKTNPKIK